MLTLLLVIIIAFVLLVNEQLAIDVIPLLINIPVFKLLILSPFMQTFPELIVIKDFASFDVKTKFSLVINVISLFIMIFSLENSFPSPQIIVSPANASSIAP